MESPTLSTSAFPDSPRVPAPNDAALEEALDLGTKARQLDAVGSYFEAERLLHQALDLLAGPATPDSSPAVARLSNGLGETYLHMGRLDDAERWFAKSLDLAATVRDFADIAAARENVARVQRARRELLKAKALRMLGAPEDMRCSNYSVRPATLSGLCAAC